MPSGNTNSDQNLGPKVGAVTHPLYTLFKPIWVQLADVREGTGGFLSTGNDSYLVAHPREWLDHSAKVTETVNGVSVTTTRLNPNPRSPSPKLKARRALARYENVASAILEAKKAVLFREQPTRRVGNGASGKDQKATPLEQWWLDVDGDATHIDDAMPQWWDLAATFGHVVLYFDVAKQTEQPLTAADQPQPFVRVYTPLDVLDWRRNDDGRLIWIKLLEAVQPPPSLTGRVITTYRVRIIDEEKWALYDYKQGGAAIEQGVHDLGKLPIVYLYGKRRSMLTDVGESVLGDPRNYIDLFNLTSEIRELLRNQTFSFINLPLGSGPDAMSVEQAQAMMGQQTGTMNVLFSGLQAQMLTGDPANVQSYHDEIARVKREIYRETGVQWESDSKDAEAAQSLELKREEMTTRVAAYADECQQTEYLLVDLWYRYKYGPDQAESKREADAVAIHYPEHFAQTPFKEVLDQAAAAAALGMPTEFLKAMRKALITKFEGMANLAPEELQKIVDAIDTAPDDPTPQERMQQKMKLAEAAVKNGGKPAFGKEDGAAA